MAVHIVPAGSTHTQAESAFTAIASDTDALIRLVFQAGTHTWNPSGTMNLGVPATCTEFHFEGEGWNDTIILDDFTGTYNNLLNIGGVNAKFRIHDFQFKPGPNYSNHREAHFSFNGVTTNFRAHDIKVPYVAAYLNKLFNFNGYVRGVIDHCQVSAAVSIVFCAVSYDYPDGNGDTRWAEATPKGTLNNMFVEDCYVVTYNARTVVVNDTDHGGCVVARFGEFGSMGVESHGTNDRGRGGRHVEAYCNKFTHTALDSTTGSGFGYAIGFVAGGTFYIWGNTLDPINGFDRGFTIRTQRADPNAYGQLSPPSRWGFSGTAGNYLYGLVNTSGTAVTKTTGNPWIGGVGAQGWALYAGSKLNINGTDYTINSVNSGTSITLTGSAGTQTGVYSYPPTNWDGNTDVYGYPNLDQPGRGQGDFLSGSFPTCVNVTQGNAPWTSVDAYPNQAREPVYIWTTPWVVPPGWSFNYIQNETPYVVAENRDYFTDYVGTGVTGGGVIVGTEAEMNADTGNFVGQAYWVTDLGDWNDGSNAQYTGQGQLWVWDGADWIFDYEPAPYPHPLIVSDGGEPIPAGRKTRYGKVRRSF